MSQVEPIADPIIADKIWIMKTLRICLFVIRIMFDVL